MAVAPQSETKQYKTLITIITIVFCLGLSALSLSFSNYEIHWDDPKAHPYIDVFGIFIPVVFIVINSWLFYEFSIGNYNRHSVTYGPEILTTIGILGCFLGILLALLGFNTEDISKSVPSLMVGIRTGFFSSVAGILGAVGLRLQHRFGQAIPSQNPEQPKAANLDDLIGVMNAMREDSAKHMQQLHKDLTGDDQDSTLLSQIKKLRTDTIDQLKELRISFEKFKDHMMENTQKGIIEALEGVMRDFNAKINEQFGENFKQLNDAVGKLLVWQQQYKEELDQIKSYQQQAANDFTQSAKNMQAVVEQAQDFSSIANNLQNILNLLENRITTLNEQERALAEVLSSMQNITPEFSQKIDLLLAELTKGVTNIQSTLQTTSTELKNSVTNSQTEVNNHLKDNAKSINSELKQFISDIESGIKNVQTTMLAAADESRIALINNYANMNTNIEKNQKDTNAYLQQNLSAIRQGVSDLDKGLNEELNKSLQGLGQQLASLSNKFVTDYSPLTDRLREIVRIAEGVRR